MIRKFYDGQATEKSGGEGSESYWKKRCEAAEEQITVLCNYKKGSRVQTESWKKWQQLKSSIGEETEGQDEWISVEDRLPELEKAVNVSGQYGNKLITLEDTAYYSKGRRYDNSNDMMLAENFIKYWQPLPKPPKPTK